MAFARMGFFMAGIYISGSIVESLEMELVSLIVDTHLNSR
jgi:hypothetical protein